MRIWKCLLIMLQAVTACVTAPTPGSAEPGAQFLHSRDDGKTWHTIRVPENTFFPPRLRRIWGFDHGPLFLLVSLDGAELALYRIDTPGGPWQKEYSGNQDIDALWGASPEAIYAVGSRGRILHRFGPGDWRPIPSGTTYDFYGIWGSSAENIFTAGEDGILRSTDRGATWHSVFYQKNALLYAIWGSSASDVYAVGANGLIVHTIDGGARWTAQHGPPTDLVAVWGSSDDDVYLVGGRGLILHSADHGQSFARQPGVPQERLLTVFGSSKSAVIAAGLSGIERTTDGGRTWQPALFNSSYTYLASWGSPGQGLFVVGVPHSGVMHNSYR